MSISAPLPISYPPINNLSTTNAYPTTDGASNCYRTCAGCARVNLDISGAAVYYQLGQQIGGAINWQPERYLLPTFRSLERAFDAIRLRSATNGVPARVTVDVLTPSDLGT